MDESSPPKPDLPRAWPCFVGPAMLAVATVVAMLAASAWFGVLFGLVAAWSVDAWFLRRTMATALDLSDLLDRIGDQRDEAIRQRDETFAQLEHCSRQAIEIARTALAERLAFDSEIASVVDEAVDRANDLLAQEGAVGRLVVEERELN